MKSHSVGPVRRFTPHGEPARSPDHVIAADSCGEWVLPVPEDVRIRAASSFGLRRPGQPIPGSKFCL